MVGYSNKYIRFNGEPINNSSFHKCHSSITFSNISEKSFGYFSRKEKIRCNLCLKAFCGVCLFQLNNIDNVSTEEFVSICRRIRDEGAANINIVTGAHAVPALVEALQEVRDAMIELPVLWNSSAYENVAALEMLAGTVDGYLPDLKTLDSDLASRFFSASDYPSVAVSAIEQMMKQSCTVIIRHLVLPGLLHSTYDVLRWFAEKAAGRAQLSLMMQYTPVAQSLGAPARFVNEHEYETVLSYLDEFGIDEGFYQELQPDSEWLPDFSKANPFSSDLSKPIWHAHQCVKKFPRG